MNIEEFNNLDEKTRQIILEEALELYNVIRYENITTDTIKFIGKLCTYFGYGIRDLNKRLNPHNINIH
ncbi:hypothetical protein GNF86_02045 [Clostridium perfringens]